MKKDWVLSRFQKAISSGIACGYDVRVCNVIVVAFGCNHSKPDQNSVNNYNIYYSK
jgi:hypothetical protein